MGRRKKGYQQSLDDTSGSNKAKRAAIKQSLNSQHPTSSVAQALPPISLSEWDVSYLQMIKDTCGGGSSKVEQQEGSVENVDIAEMVKQLLEQKSLLQLRSDVQKLSHQSQGGSNFNQASVANLACFLFLGQQFSQIKKYTQAILLTIDEKTVLNSLENIIIEFACSDPFEMQANNVHEVYGLMRAFEYKLMTYFEMYHRIVEQNPLSEDDPAQHDEVLSVKYEVQADFISVVQQKICFVLSKQSSSNLRKHGFVMNSNSTKSLVEFLHAYLNFLGRFNSLLKIEHNFLGLDFIGDQLQNSLTNRDILTQSSILFWMLFKISPLFAKVDHTSFLRLCLGTHDLSSLLKKSSIEEVGEVKVQRGILQMAKIRGYVLAMDRTIDLNKELFSKIHLSEGEEEVDLANYILLNCEKNEGLQKLYSFHTLESVLTRLQSVREFSWLDKVVKLLLKNFEYPLHSISTCCESLLKKLLNICDKAQLQFVLDKIKSINSKHEIKSKYVALGLALDNIDPIQYFSQNPQIVKEMLYYSTEILVMGKYVLGFFEAFLKKLWSAVNKDHEAWHRYWMDDYINCLFSENDSLRQAVGQLITPIVIKINSMSIAFILSRYLQEFKQGSLVKSTGVSQLSSLMTLLKIARSNKMISICDESKDIRLDSKVQEELDKLGAEGQTAFSILQADLLNIVLSQDWKLSLDCFLIVTQEQKSKAKSDFGLIVSPFEYEMCLVFIKNCIKTTYPEHRQNFMKAIRTFLMKLRSQLAKEIKSYVSGETEASPDILQLVSFLREVCEFCESNLYVDKPIDAALPLFEVLKMVQDLYGDYDFHVRVTQVLGATNLLSKEDLMQSEEFLIFLLNCLKSSWSLVRLNALDILLHFPPNHPLLNDPKFVNGVILNTAMQFCNNPKAMIAEGAGLLFKVLFNKSLDHVDFGSGRPEAGKNELQLAFCKNIFDLIKKRLSVFKVSLIKEGKTTDLLHGLLAFFKNLFSDFKIRRGELSDSQFQEWRQFFKELIQLCLEISGICSSILSNNRLQDEAEGDQIEVDCRGHPINKTKKSEVGDSQALAMAEEYGDYDNLILVGVWLAVKENGQTLFNLLRWVELPATEDDDTKFLDEADIRGLCQSLIRMLFEFKHRGAIEKAAESFSLLCNKLLCSNLAKFQSLPKEILQQVFERITHENHSTILRRSAGIPPTILAILRSEPLSNQPELLNMTLNFLIDLARTSSDTDDKKIHALNILRFIFQDSLLKHDIVQFITPAMILATDNFQSDNWSIRNSTLMCFTSLTKRMLNTTLVQDQDLSRKKGLSIWEFVTKYKTLSDYFKGKLKEYFTRDKTLSRELMERQDMVIYSILLLLSRLVPAFQLVDSSNYAEESKEEEKAGVQVAREQSMQEFVGLIKQYSKSGTYFVRKLCAQALLPIQRFEDYVQEVKSSVNLISAKISGENKMRQNEVHGHMIRIHTYLQAYFRYRELNQQISGRTSDEESALRIQQEKELITSFEQILSKFDQGLTAFSPIIMGLFLKSYRCLLKNTKEISSQRLSEVHDFMAQRLQAQIQEKIQKIKEGQIDTKTEHFSFLKDLTRTVLLLKSEKSICDLQGTKQLLELVIGEQGFVDNNIDFTYLFLKAFMSKMKVLRSQVGQGSEEFKKFSSDCLQILTSSLSQIDQKNDENFCKVLEYLLKIIYRITKNLGQITDSDLLQKLGEILESVVGKFKVNANVLAVYIKLRAVMVSAKSQGSELAEVSRILREHAYADKKEQVRVANVKSVCRVLQSVDLHSHPAHLVDLFTSLVLILNDEHPEIRAYLLQHPSSQNLVDQKAYSIQSSSLQSGSSLVVDLNEQLLLKSLFNSVIAMATAHSEGALKTVANEFLVAPFIVGNPYREHVEKNFDDKIFFFEPINKYYDLLHLKKMVYLKLKEISSSLVDSATLEKAGAALKQVEVKDNRLTETCLQMEENVHRLVLEKVSGKDISAFSTSSAKFVNSLKI